MHSQSKKPKRLDATLKQARASPGKEPMCGTSNGDSESPTLLELRGSRDFDLAGLLIILY